MCLKMKKKFIQSYYIRLIKKKTKKNKTNKQKKPSTEEEKME